MLLAEAVKAEKLDLNTRLQRAFIHRVVERTRYERYCLREIEQQWRQARQAIITKIRQSGLFHLQIGKPFRAPYGTTTGQRQNQLALLVAQIASIIGSMIHSGSACVRAHAEDLLDLEVKEVPLLINRYLGQALQEAEDLAEGIETVLYEYIIKVKGGYRVISHQTGKNLGTFPSRAAARRRLRQLARFREQFDEETLQDILLEYNPYHVQSGPEGGQFTSAGGGGGDAVDERAVNQAANELSDMMREWHNTSSKASLKELVDYTMNPTPEWKVAIQRTLDRLPWSTDGTVTLYRGGSLEGRGKATSWSTDREWARRFATYGFGKAVGAKDTFKDVGQIHEQTFKRDDLLVALPWEGEVLVRNSAVKKERRSLKEAIVISDRDLLQILLEYNPYHVQSGPEGGQFTSAGGGGEGGESHFDPMSTGVSWSDRFPPVSTDKPPGGKYEYHAAPGKMLQQISNRGLRAGQGGIISVAPHLESAHFWGDAVEAGKTGAGDLVYLMRMERAAIQKDGIKILKPPDEQDKPVSDKDPGREHTLQLSRRIGSASEVYPGRLEIYFKGTWTPLRTLVPYKAATREALELLEAPEDLQPLQDLNPFTAGPTNLFPPPAVAADVTFSSIPVGAITHLLRNPLGGEAFAASFADMGTALLTRLKNTLMSGLLRGTGVGGVAKQVQGVLGNTKWQAERIVRSEFGRVTNQAALAQFDQNKELLNGVQWVATLDDRTCLECGDLDGEVYDDPADAPVPVVDTHPNCFIPETHVEGDFLAGTRMRYRGPILTFKTRKGKELTVTPNHPILTASGLLPAHKIQKGDDLLCRGPWLPYGYVQDVPPTIKQVFDTLAIHGFGNPASVTVQDFHGDAFFGEPKVDIVLADRELLPYIKSSSNQRFGDLRLKQTDMKSAFHSSLGAKLSSLGRVFHTTSALPCGLELSSYELRRGSDVLPLQTLGVRTAADIHTLLTEASSQNTSADASFALKLFQRASGKILRDEVIEIRNGYHDGHVYDLQSVTGFIVANDVITSNCRCTLVPVVKGAEEMGLDAVGPGTRASMTGQVPATQTYDEWFGNQSPTLQSEILGPTRYRLWSQNKIELTDFVSSRGIRSVKSVLRSLGEAVELVEFNPHHVQSGPEGGQFTSGDTGSTESTLAEPTNEQLRDYIKEISAAMAARLARGEQGEMLYVLSAPRRMTEEVMKLAYQIEQASSRQAMLDVLESQMRWTSSPTIAPLEWAYAEHLGVKSIPKGIDKVTLSKEQIKAFDARTLAIQNWARANMLDPGASTVSLYRGIRGAQSGKLRKDGAKEGSTVDLGVYGLSSWADNRSGAQMFAMGGGKAKGMVLKTTDVPIKDIFLLPRSFGPQSVFKFSDDHGETVLLTRGSKTRSASVYQDNG